MVKDISERDPGTELENLEQVDVPGILREYITPPEIKNFKDWKALSPQRQQEVKANSLMRRQVVFILLAQGKGYSELAREFKVTPAQILEDGRRMARELAAAGVSELEYERQKAMFRLDQLTETYFQRALDGDIEAGTLLLQIESRRARLTGIDRPIKMKIDHTHRKAPVQITDAEFERRMMDLAYKASRKNIQIPKALKDRFEQVKDRLEVVEGTVIRVLPPVTEVTADSAHSGQKSQEKEPSGHTSAPKSPESDDKPT